MTDPNQKPATDNAVSVSDGSTVSAQAQLFVDNDNWAGGVPPFVGWWETRLRDATHTSRWPTRRFFSPDFGGWSLPVYADGPAKDSDEDVAAVLLAGPANEGTQSRIEWRGRSTPPAEGYATILVPVFDYWWKP